MNQFKKENIKAIEPEFDFYGPQIRDDSLIEISSYQMHGDIIFIPVFIKNNDVVIFPEIKNNVLIVKGVHEIEMAFSNKDDALCIKEITEFQNLENYEVLTYDSSEKSTIVLIPKEFL